MTLYQQLCNLLTRHPELAWPSESDYPIQAVSMNKSDLVGWEMYEADAFPTFVRVVNRGCEQENCPCNQGELFYLMCPRNCEKKAWNLLEELLDTGDELISYTRPNEAEKATDLLVVVETKQGLVGLQTIIVQT